MTTSVDVLAVLDRAAEREKDAGQPYVAQVAARAAVAELIEAAEKYHKARNIQQRVDSSARLVSAIARVKGA
ncbi:hypothetical protein QV000_07275 [Stenotrophomonas maltophilia]